ncbi:MAG: class A beta-lactamase [Caulobacteraceae bacterium]
MGPTRRLILPGMLALGAVLGACRPEIVGRSHTPKLDTKLLDRDFPALAEKAAPGVFVGAVMNLESGEAWHWNSEKPVPMQSVFKAALGAAALAQADAGRLPLDRVVNLTEMDLSPAFSSVADAFPGRSEYTIQELLQLAVKVSDNTAADVLMKQVGGPGVVTAWLKEHGIEGLRIDRYERELQADLSGTAPYRPEWKGAQWDMVRAAVPEMERRAAFERYMADPRDTITTHGALDFLARLASGALLSTPSTLLLLKIMTETSTGPNRLKAGLPAGAALAHKTGTGPVVLGVNAATNDMGIVTLADHRRYALAAFVAGCPAPETVREGLIADFARLAVKAAG